MTPSNPTPADTRIVELVAFQLFACESARALNEDYQPVSKTDSAVAAAWRAKADDRAYFTGLAETMVTALAEDGVAVRVATQRTIVKATTDLATVPATLAYTPGALPSQFRPRATTYASEQAVG